MIEVELPDGSIAEFPEGTSNDVIKGALQKRFGAPQNQSRMTQKQPRNGPFPTMADSRNFMQTVDDGMRAAANGLTFGVADRVEAYMNGNNIEGQVTGKTPLEQSRARSEQARERSPITSAVGEIGGSMLGAGKIMQAGGTASRLIPQGLTGAKAMIAKMLAGGADGVALNELSNVGYGRDFGENAGAAALLGGAAPMVGDALSAGASKVMGAFNPKIKAPNLDQLKNAKNAAYQRVDDLGVRYKPEAMNDLITGIDDSLAAGRIDDVFHPLASRGQKVIKQSLEGKSPTLPELDDLRKYIGNNVKDPIGGPQEQGRFAGMMKGNIDEFIDATGPNQIISGNAEQGAKAIKEARAANLRYSKYSKIDDALYRADMQAGSTASGGNIDNATRQKIKNILLDPRKMRGYTSDETELMEKIVKGSGFGNKARQVGKLSPNGNGLQQAMAIGATAYNPAMAAFPATGMIAKWAADRTTKKMTKELLLLIASGGKKEALQAPKNAAQKVIENNKALIARILMGGSIPMLANNNAQ